MTDPFLDHETGLIDLTDLPLAQLMNMDESVLAESLRRVAEAADRQEDVVVGFDSNLT
jgi:FXSXX-COOH protein